MSSSRCSAALRRRGRLRRVRSSRRCRQSDFLVAGHSTVSQIVCDGKKGLPRIRYHDLRHAHATHLLSSDVHPKVASERGPVTAAVLSCSGPYCGRSIGKEEGPAPSGATEAKPPLGISPTGTGARQARLAVAHDLRNRRS